MSVFCEPLEADTTNVPRPGRGGRTGKIISQISRQGSGVSRWIHDENRIGSFAWQEGYGAITVSAATLPDRKSTIAKRTFQDEFREFLDRCGIAYDERYLW